MSRNRRCGGRSLADVFFFQEIPHLYSVLASPGACLSSNHTSHSRKHMLRSFCHQGKPYLKRQQCRDVSFAFLIYVLCHMKFFSESQWSELTYLYTSQHLYPPSSRFTQYVHILHTTPQARLYTLRLPPEDIHDSCPTQTRKNRPRIPLDGRFRFWTESLREKSGCWRRGCHDR